MSEQPIVFQCVVAVTSNDEWCNPIDAACIELTESAIKRILQLADIAEEHAIASIHDFNYFAEWGFFDDDGKGFIPTGEAGDRNENGPFRAECNQVVVHGLGENSYACWNAYWKHTNVEVSTDAIAIRELREALAQVNGPVRAALSGEKVGLTYSSA